MAKPTKKEKKKMHRTIAHNIITSPKGNFLIGIYRTSVGPLIKKLQKIKCS